MSDREIVLLRFSEEQKEMGVALSLSALAIACPQCVFKRSCSSSVVVV